MNRRSNSVRIEKYCLVKYLADDELGICRTDMVKGDDIKIGEECEAPFKGKFYSATIIALNGMFTFSYYRVVNIIYLCLLYTSPSPRDATLSRMPSSA